jgi:hypothetical protein
VIGLGIQLAIAAGALVSATVGGYWLGSKHVRGEWDAEKVEQQEVIVEAQRQARIAETLKAKKSQEVQDAVNAARKKDQAAASAARDELGRLRESINASSPTPGSASSASRSDGASREVAGQCAARLVEVAESHDSCAGKLTGLQDWVRQVVQ